MSHQTLLLWFLNQPREILDQNVLPSELKKLPLIQDLPPKVSNKAKPWEDPSDEDDHVVADDDEDMYEEEMNDEFEPEQEFVPESDEEEDDEDIGPGGSKDGDDEEEMEPLDDEDSGQGDSSRPSLRMTIRVPKYLELDEEVKKTIPELTLPDSSDDLVIPRQELMEVVSIYEILRHFSNILRLSPFRFEDFTTALMVDEQSPLISEIHIQLLKSLIREDEANGTLYVPSDLKDAVQINFLFIDHVTWPDVLRLYLSSDMKTNGDLIEACFRGKEYPFCGLQRQDTSSETLVRMFPSDERTTRRFG